MDNILNLQYVDLNKIIDEGEYDKVCVEIGCGNGTFLLNHSSKNPKSLIFGIDVSSLSVVKSAALLQKNKIKNAFVLKFDARFIGKVFNNKSVDVVYMNYPIPWIRKTKRRSHRVVTNRFVKELSNILKFKGRFRMISDSKWYIDYVAGKFLATPYFLLYNYKKSSTPFINTKYEKKWISEGRSLYWLELSNTNDKIGKKEDEIMPHIFLDDVDEKKILSINNNEFIDQDNGYIYKSAYKGKEEILIKTISIDEGFNQNYFIKVVKRNDKYMVKLDDFAKPIITEGVKNSVFNFRDFIIEKEE
jgi:tRNA (guanine-N7-)-methyltransferase